MNEPQEMELLEKYNQKLDEKKALTLEIEQLRKEVFKVVKRFPDKKTSIGNHILKISNVNKMTPFNRDLVEATLLKVMLQQFKKEDEARAFVKNYLTFVETCRKTTVIHRLSRVPTKNES